LKEYEDKRNLLLPIKEPAQMQTITQQTQKQEPGQTQQQQPGQTQQQQPGKMQEHGQIQQNNMQCT
jgi:hypothetical protein